jgi:hypothetical protein
MVEKTETVAHESLGRHGLVARLRAEIEGQLDQFRSDPGLLAGLADAYRAHNPEAPAPRRVAVLLRHHQISRSGPTGRYTDEVVAAWTLS